MSEWRAGGWCLCDTPPGESALAAMQRNTITILGNGDKEGKGLKVSACVCLLLDITIL